jgi:putative cell wall-binding protein
LSPLLLLVVLVTVIAAVTFIVVAHRLDERRHDRMRPSRPLVPVLIVSGLLAVGGGWLAARGVLGEGAAGEPQVLLDEGGGATAGDEVGAGTPGTGTPGTATTGTGGGEPDEDEPAGREPLGELSGLGELGEPDSDVRVAAALSARLRPDDGADDVLLVRPGPSVDLLLASGLQGLLDAVILMTQAGELSAEAAEEIDRLGTPEVHIIGGSGVVSATVQQRLLDAGHAVHRHAGAWAGDTALDIAAAHFPEATTAVLAPSFIVDDDSTGEAAGLLAAAASVSAQELPVLLSGRDELTAQTASYLAGSLIEEVVVLDGEQAWAPQVLADLEELGIAVTRVEGADRYETAAAVAASGDHLRTDTPLYLVDGEGARMWPGLLVALLHGAPFDAAILLSAGEEVPPPTAAALSEAAGGRGGARLACATGVTEAACAQARLLLDGPDAEGPDAEGPDDERPAGGG